MMLGNIAPQECYDIMHSGMTGHLDQARTIQDRVLELDWQVLTRQAAGLKAALQLLGFESGLPRAPSRVCNRQAIQQIQEAMRIAKVIP